MCHLKMVKTLMFWRNPTMLKSFAKRSVAALAILFLALGVAQADPKLFGKKKKVKSAQTKS